MKKAFSFKNFKKFSAYTLFGALIIFFSACTKSNDAAPQISYSNIAGINASENTPADFSINNIKANSNSIAPGQVIGYFSVLPTTNTVDFRVAGTSSVIATTNVDCSANSFYSVFLGDANSIVTLQDDRTSPQTGKARVRFLNISSYLTRSVDFGSTGANTKIITGIANKTASGYVEVDPSISSISVYDAGSATPLINTSVTLQAGHIYVFYVTGTTNGTLTGKLLTQI